MPQPAPILIIDDSPAALHLYSMILSNSGHFVEVVDTRQKALSRIRKNKPALVLLDYTMPDDMSNEAFAEAVKEFQPVRVVGFSSHDIYSPAAKEMKRLFGEYLEKPYSGGEMIDAIERLYDHRAS